jgi:hypothetical protein
VSDSPASVTLDAFFDSFHRLHPVTASFAGVHAYDHLLPDYSPEGLMEARREMSRARRLLAEAGLGVLHPADVVRTDWTAIDGSLADACLELRLAEDDSPHFVRGNPALAIGEAVFSLVAIVGSDGVRADAAVTGDGGAPLEARVEAAIARLRAFPGFLHGARRTLGEGPVPVAWRERAVRDCDGGLLLLADLPGWPVAMQAPLALCRALQDAATEAAAAVDWFRAFVAARPDAPVTRYAAGHGLLDLTIRRGHWCDRPVERLRHEARAALEREQVRLADLLRDAGVTSWTEVARRLDAQSIPPGDVLAACDEAWREARRLSSTVMSWPDRMLRFVPMAAWMRRAARLLPWRLYRSPPLVGPPDTDWYAVPVPDEDDDGATRDAFARAWNRASIRLLHAVHHGGPGRHVHYWHAARSPSRVGRLAALDGARRTAMTSGGTMCEGWSAYATEITEELGFFTPDERLSAERERVHLMVRAVVDLELHTGRLSFDEAVRFHHTAALVPEHAARAEVTRCSMFPGTGVMRWLGLRGLWQARHDAESGAGPFDARAFHDAVLSCGSIPMPLAARLLAARRAANPV